MLGDLERNAERPVLEQLENGVLRPRVTCKQIHRLSEHRFTDEERRIELLDALGGPAVVLFRPVEKSDERSRINDGGGHRGRSLRDDRDSKQARELRNRSPRVRASSARRRSDADASCAELRERAAAPPRSNP